MSVIVDQRQAFKPFVRFPRCKLPSYSHLDYAMRESRQTNLSQLIDHAFAFTNIQRSFSTPCLSLTRSVLEDEVDFNPRIEIVSGQRAPKARALVVEVTMAMASSVSPEPVSSGLGGAYFLRARNGDIIAVAKPIDEEPLAINNPKGFAAQMSGQPGLKRSIRVGETGLRELAAYLLDHGGFAGVPPTALVKFADLKFHVNDPESTSTTPHKIASLQHFVKHDSDASDLGPSGFSVTSVHRVGILDVRLLNLDRHSGNILVKHGKEFYAAGAAELVPIDHGLCLPESLDDPYFEWLHWPQASMPFSEAEVGYIANLDPFKDAELLRTEIPSLRESSIRVLVLCTMFLKQATASGLCLADIGKMMTREFQGGEEHFSELENICVVAMSSLCHNTLTEVDGKGNRDEEEYEMDQFGNEYKDGINPGSRVPELQEMLQTGDQTKEFPKIFSAGPMNRLDDVWSSLNKKCDNNSNDCYSNGAMNDGDKNKKAALLL